MITRRGFVSGVKGPPLSASAVDSVEDDPMRREIRRARERGMSIRQIAYVFGVPRSTVSDIVTPRRSGRPEMPYDRFLREAESG